MLAPMLQLLAIGCGGFLGAIARFGLSGWVQRATRSTFPWGTLAVNVVGCFALGVLMTLVEERSWAGPTARSFVAVGILGSFTTFSTFGVETFELLRSGGLVPAAGNVGGNVVVGLVAVWCGRAAVLAAGSGA